MVDMLGFISDQLDQLGIPYEFSEWTDRKSTRLNSSHP